MTSIAAAARDVLLTVEPRQKIFFAWAVARAWGRGELNWAFDIEMPAEPGRPHRPLRLPASRMPKRGRAGSERARIAMLHALAHIEYGAIDLAFDMIGRFGDGAPRSFVDDWIKVGADEALHFALLMRRLRDLGSSYGALPAHDGLWEAAHMTSHDRLARLAIVPMILEARGLDVTPATICRFEAAGDSVSARILSRIYRDEISHVAVGVNWFRHFCGQQRFGPAIHWQTLVRRYFRGSLKPPFNNSARNEAGLTMDFYSSLAASG
ncbi:MAG: ferritin-like domain-containing protein [Sphingomonadaceae bacterium]